MRKLCVAPNCRRLADEGAYCSAHFGIRDARRQDWERAKRSKQSESYQGWYQTAAWRKRKAEHLAKHPGCAKASGACSGRLEVHHLVAHKGSWAIFIGGPLATLCKHHHDLETARETRVGAYGA